MHVGSLPAAFKQNGAIGEAGRLVRLIGGWRLIFLCGTVLQWTWLQGYSRVLRRSTFQTSAISAAGLDEWQRSVSFKRTTIFYLSYPARSLLSHASRAVLHHLIVMKRPRLALEIGTYQAGTSEVMARAMWEAGQGHLETIDPYGASVVRR